MQQAGSQGSEVMNDAKDKAGHLWCLRGTNSVCLGLHLSLQLRTLAGQCKLNFIFAKDL